jgi:hypothetical protein
MRYDVYKDRCWLHNHLAFVGQHGKKFLPCINGVALMPRI